MYLSNPAQRTNRTSTHYFVRCVAFIVHSSESMLALAEEGYIIDSNTFSILYHHYAMV